MKLKNWPIEYIEYQQWWGKPPVSAQSWVLVWQILAMIDAVGCACSESVMCDDCVLQTLGDELIFLRQ